MQFINTVRQRALNGQPVEMDVKTLVVVDATVYQDAKTFLNTNDDLTIFQHIRNYYAHTFNGVIHVLIITNPEESTWTLKSVVGEAGNETYNALYVSLPW
ncbi:unnamed protein product [Brachionus calyciflorus]|uniref:Uncharacterized protein n=1 Tax=Brachionus calyciflorus TaxID=104777 RepID=A0A814IU81_9BILA|nr:unnamed protein product [Brachionus calyciflorus]